MKIVKTNGQKVLEDTKCRIKYQEKKIVANVDKRMSVFFLKFYL